EILSTNCIPRILPSRRRTTTSTTFVSLEFDSTMLRRILHPGSRDCANVSDVTSTFIPFPLTCDNRPSSRPVSSYTRASSPTSRRGKRRRWLLDFTSRAPTWRWFGAAYWMFLRRSCQFLSRENISLLDTLLRIHYHRRFRLQGNSRARLPAM